MTRVKICGLRREADIDAVNEAQPDYCGFIFHVPSSRRSITDTQAAQLRANLDPRISAVGVFVDEPVEHIAALLRDGVIDVAQLHGHETDDDIQRLRACSNAPIWRALRIRSQSDVAQACASPADFVLLDAGQGSGTVFDWSLITGINRPFGLAGGLNASNMKEALHTGAALLDVSGGVETDGWKDRAKICDFVQRVRREDS